MEDLNPQHLGGNPMHLSTIIGHRHIKKLTLSNMITYVLCSTGQLIWREYFYTMSVNNANFGQIRDNPICLNIPWSEPAPTIIEKYIYFTLLYF